MAEATTFLTENASQIQNCLSTVVNGTGSCKQSSEINGNSLNSITAREVDGNLENEMSRPCGTGPPLDQSTVAVDAGNSLDLLSGATLGNDTNMLSKSSEIKMNNSNDQLQLSNQVNQAGDMNTCTATDAATSTANNTTTDVTAGSLPVATGLSNTSSTMSTLKPSISGVILPQQNCISMASTSDLTSVTQTASCTSATSVPGNTWSSVALPKIPAPCPNSFVILKDDSKLSLSSPNPLSFPQTPVTLSTPAILDSQIVPAANNMVVRSFAPVAIQSLEYKSEGPQLNVAPSVEMTNSSTLSLPVTASIITMGTNVPAAVNTQGPEATVSVPNDGTATSAITETQTSSPPSTKDGASVFTADSSNIVPEILTAFSNFTPCAKCNSLLVCSCPGPSSSGQCDSVASATCSASCQGVCTCDGMTVDQTNVSNPSPPDVKPQIFPVLVSMH